MTSFTPEASFKQRLKRNVSLQDHLKMEMEMEIPSVKASANSDITFFFTSAQDGNKLLDDERLSLADDLKKRMMEKMQSPQCVENKVRIAPPDYSK
ncbi:hypothetical protein Tco_0219976, partial [Tanacetum coccineum]